MRDERMKRVVLSRGFLHVETPLGIVNIQVGLHDHKGRRVESIEIITNKYAGEKRVRRSGFSNNRLIENLHLTKRGKR